MGFKILRGQFYRASRVLPRTARAATFHRASRPYSGKKNWTLNMHSGHNKVALWYEKVALYSRPPLRIESASPPLRIGSGLEKSPQTIFAKKRLVRFFEVSSEQVHIVDHSQS